MYAHVHLLELAVGRASTRQSRLGAHAAHHLRLDLIGQMRWDDAGQQPLLLGHINQSESAAVATLPVSDRRGTIAATEELHMLHPRYAGTCSECV